MSVANNIVRSYRRPGAVVRAILDQGPREDRALMFLFAACGLIFVGQWPLAARMAHLDPEVPLNARLGAALMVWLFVMPLFFYGLAWVSRQVARLFGGRGTNYSARVALFWTLLVTAPFLLLRGLTAGLIGPGVELILVDTLATLCFVGHWAATLYATEGSPSEAG